jgi:hypothetical protein
MFSPCHRITKPIKIPQLASVSNSLLVYTKLFGEFESRTQLQKQTTFFPRGQLQKNNIIAPLQL